MASTKNTLPTTSGTSQATPKPTNIQTNGQNVPKPPPSANVQSKPNGSGGSSQTSKPSKK